MHPWQQFQLSNTKSEQVYEKEWDKRTNVEQNLNIFVLKEFFFPYEGYKIFKIQGKKKNCRLGGGGVLSNPFCSTDGYKTKFTPLTYALGLLRNWQLKWIMLATTSLGSCSMPVAHLRMMQIQKTAHLRPFMFPRNDNLTTILRPFMFTGNDNLTTPYNLQYYSHSKI